MRMRIRMRRKDENEEGDEYAQFFQKKQAYACFFSRCQKFSAANGGKYNEMGDDRKFCQEQKTHTSF